MNLRMNNVRFLLILFVTVGIFLCLSLSCASVEDKMKQISVCQKSGDEKSIKTLLKYLKDKDEKIRVEAAQALGATSPCWCPGHEEPTEIGRLNDPRVMKALLKLLKDESPRVRLAAVYSLIPYKSPIMVEPLIEALKDTSGKIRERDAQFPVGVYAAYILGKLEDKRAVEPLLFALISEHREIRGGAKRALWNIKVDGIQDKQIIEALLNALRSEDYDVRSHAREGLRIIKEKERLAEEIKRLTPFFLADLQSDFPDILIRGVRTVGMFKIREAVPRLENLLRNEHPQIRAYAAGALLSIRDESSVPALREALKDSNAEVRKHAVEALGRMGQKSALPEMLPLLQDIAPSVRIAAMYAVARFDEPEIFPRIVEAIWDDNTKVARAAILVVSATFDRGKGNPQAHKDVVPRVIQLMKGMNRSYGYRRCRAEFKILVAVKDVRAFSEIYNAFKTWKVEDGLFTNEDRLVIKMATFIAELGSDEQREEAIEWLKKVSTQNPNKDNRRYAAEALKELGVAKDLL